MCFYGPITFSYSGFSRSCPCINVILHYLFLRHPPSPLQVPVLTEILLNDAEVERSAAASEPDSWETGTALAGPLGGPNSNNGGEGGTRQALVAAPGTAPVFRSRRVSPGRLCPVPALLGSTVVDTDGRPVGGKGAAVLVSAYGGHMEGGGVVALGAGQIAAVFRYCLTFGVDARRKVSRLLLQALGGGPC